MTKLSNTQKLLLIHLFCHAMLVPAVLYGEIWMFIASFIWWQVIAATSISSGYHRYFSHRSFETGEWYKWYTQFIALFANPGPVLTWAAAHRMHHAYSDTDKDPHSPVYKGFWKVYTSRWGDDVTIERRMLKDLLQDKSIMFFHNHYFKLIFSIGLIFFLVDPLLFLFGLCVPIVFAFHGYAILNAYTHRTGQPTNSWVANIFTAGEGWHKNHHQDSKNWRIGWSWWQIDTAAAFIKLIKR